MLLRFLGLTVALVLSLGCKQEIVNNEKVADWQSVEWEDIVDRAKHSKVRLAMWDGDPMINRYMRKFVVPRLAQEFQIELEIVGRQGNQIVNQLMVEMETGQNKGTAEIVWINGENFYQLRQIDALLGPFTDKLPNNQFIDWDDPTIAYDFQQPVAGYECPWGNVQLALIYHTNRVTDPPRNWNDLENWINANPGRFTFDSGFTGMTFLKSLLFEINSAPDVWDGEFNEAVYSQASQELWNRLRRVKPNLWKQGKTYPEGPAQLHQLLMNNEVDFSMSNNDGEVDNKVLQGVLPSEAMGYVLDGGTVRNSHYLGIPKNTPNVFGALVAIDFMISFEAQLAKADPEVWGDGTVLALDKLPAEWRTKFSNIPNRERIASRNELKSKALKEPSSELMMRLNQDFRKEILGE